jgi:hypothetical protein
MDRSRVYTKAEFCNRWIVHRARDGSSGRTGLFDGSTRTKSKHDDGLEASGGGYCLSHIKPFEGTESRILTSASEVEVLKSTSDSRL